MTVFENLRARDTAISALVEWANEAISSAKSGVIALELPVRDGRLGEVEVEFKENDSPARVSRAILPLPGERDHDRHGNSAADNQNP